MLKRVIGAALAICVSAMTGCLWPTEPRPRAELHVGSDTIRATIVNGIGVEWMQFRVPASVVNTGTGPLRLNPDCSSWLEWTDDTSWQKAWGAICTLIPRPLAELPPGETLHFELAVWITLQGGKASPWESPYLAGTYRLGTYVFTEKQRGIPLFSVPFEVSATDKLHADLADYPGRR